MIQTMNIPKVPSKEIIYIYCWTKVVEEDSLFLVNFHNENLLPFFFFYLLSFFFFLIVGAISTTRIGICSWILTHAKSAQE
jgi:hypothetical protein